MHRRGVFPPNAMRRDTRRPLAACGEVKEHLGKAFSADLA